MAIIITYPLACGGNFLSAVTALIFKKAQNKIKYDGSMHLTDNGYKDMLEGLVSESYIDPDYLKSIDAGEIFNVHLQNIKLLIDICPDHKVIAIVMNQDDLDLQQHNFLTKVMPLAWSESYYNVYRTDWYPAFNPDMSSMPKCVIDDILSVNRKEMQKWEYIFPEDMTNVLCINYRELLTGDTLLEKIKKFFELDNIEQSVYNLVNDYRRAQKLSNYKIN